MNNYYVYLYYIVYQIFQNELKDHNFRYRNVYKLLIRIYISEIYLYIKSINHIYISSTRKMETPIRHQSYSMYMYHVVFFIYLTKQQIANSVMC